MPACSHTDMIEEVEFRRVGPIAHVRLNRPAKLNAITDRMERALQAVWREVNADDDIRCVVLSGQGERAFCVGADMSGEHGMAGIAFGGGLTGVGGRLLELSKPLIAAIRGYCLGGGFELAMCADVIIAADDTVFGLPETTIGVIDHCGVVHRAVRRLPVSIAMGMILAGQRLSATEGAQYGLVNVVTSPAGLLEEAEQWASRIAQCPPGAILAAKAAAYCGLEMPLRDALSNRYPEIDAFNRRAG